MSLVFRLLLLALLSLLSLAGCSPYRAGEKPRRLDAIEHIVVIYAENRSFDHLYGLFPGANGIANATAAPEDAARPRRQAAARRCRRCGASRRQAPDPTVPRSCRTGRSASTRRRSSRPLGRADCRASSTATTRTSSRSTAAATTGSSRCPTAGGWTMGYFDGSKLKMWTVGAGSTRSPTTSSWARSAARSSTTSGWSARARRAIRDAPRSHARAARRQRASCKQARTRRASAMSGSAAQLLDGSVTPDGYAVNTMQPPYQPSGDPARAGGEPRFRRSGEASRCRRRRRRPSATRSPRRASPGPGTRGGWNAALADGTQPAEREAQRDLHARPGSINFQPHHQPFNYFARFAPGTADRAAHLKDGDEFLARHRRGHAAPGGLLQARRAPQRAPGYTDVLQRRRAHRRRARAPPGRARSGRAWR